MSSEIRLKDGHLTEFLSKTHHSLPTWMASQGTTFALIWECFESWEQEKHRNVVTISFKNLWIPYPINLPFLLASHVHCWLSSAQSCGWHPPSSLKPSIIPHPLTIGQAPIALHVSRSKRKWNYIQHGVAVSYHCASRQAAIPSTPYSFIHSFIHSSIPLPHLFILSLSNLSIHTFIYLFTTLIHSSFHQTCPFIHSSSP
jgi:hypothetical protein